MNKNIIKLIIHWIFIFIFWILTNGTPTTVAEKFIMLTLVTTTTINFCILVYKLSK